MAQQQSPFLEAAYGWNFGEGGWNTGMDQNLLKFSFMFDRNVDSVVASLPAAVNGQAHYLTTDNRLYFAVGSTYFSTPVPKWFEFKDRSAGTTYQFNGVSANQIDSPAQLDSRLDAVELTVASLGTAAFEDIEFFATQADLDIVEANAQAYTDSLRDDFNNISLDSIVDLLGAIQDPLQIVRTVSYHPGWAGLTSTPIGGRSFVWDATRAKADHDGGYVISPTTPWNGSVATLPAFLAGTGETDPAGFGCWVATDIDGNADVTEFGAVGDGVANKVADTAAFRAAALTGLDLRVPKVSEAGYFVSGVTRLQASAIGVGLPKVTLSKDITYTGDATNDGQAQIFRWLNHFDAAEVRGIHFVGDFDGTVGTATEHAHHVAISASSNKKVYQCVMDLPYGDGVYVGKFNWGEPDPASVDVCDNIKVFQNSITNPRRCATAFVSVTRGKFFENVATKANTFVGLLDMEPNLGDGTLVNGVEIYRNDLFCAGRTVVFYAPANDAVRNVKVTHNRIDSGSSAFDISSLDNTRFMRDIEISNNWTPNRAAPTMIWFILARNDVRGLVMRNNTDFDSGRWVIINNTDATIRGNTMDGDNTLDTSNGIEMRDCSNYTINDNEFLNIDRAIDTYGCVTILKTIVDATRVDNVSIRNNVARNCRNFIVARHATEVAANSLIIEDSDFTQNTFSITNSPLLLGAEVTLARVSSGPFKAYAVTLDFPDTASGGASDLTVSVPGAATGGRVTLGIANASMAAATGACGFYAWVSAVNTVTVRFWNASGANKNPGVSTTWTVSVIN